MTERLPNDIYRQCIVIAKNYYAMLQRRQELTEMILYGSVLVDGQPKSNSTGNPTAQKAEKLIALQSRNDYKIKAVERAWARMPDMAARDFIKFNVFQGVQMHYINLPLSIRTMKRLRSQFIFYIAEELGEI